MCFRYIQEARMFPNLFFNPFSSNVSVMDKPGN